MTMMTSEISTTPPSEALAAIQAGVTRVLRRVEIYEADGETLWVPPNGDTRSRLTGGSISLDYGRDERRTFDMTLDNSDYMLDSKGSEGFWYDKVLKPYRGVRYPAVPEAPFYLPYKDWEVQVGEFVIDQINDDYAEPILKVSGRDYTKKCLSSKLEKSMSFPAGTYIYDLIKALASNAGIKKFKIPFTNETLGSTLDLERGTERWNVMKQAANSHNYDIYFDNQGYLTMSKYTDPALSAPVQTFSTGPTGNLVSYSKSSNDSRLYNHVVVYGDRESVEGGVILMPYFGEAKNENPNSPTNIDRIGDRYYSYASSFFTSSQQCQEYANSLLAIYSLESYDINWSSINYPWLDVGQTADIYEPRSSSTTAAKFLLDSLTIPLTLDPMSATGKRVLKTA